MLDQLACATFSHWVVLPGASSAYATMVASKPVATAHQSSVLRTYAATLSTNCLTLSRTGC